MLCCCSQMLCSCILCISRGSHLKCMYAGSRAQCRSVSCRTWWTGASWLAAEGDLSVPSSSTMARYYCSTAESPGSAHGLISGMSDLPFKGKSQFSTSLGQYLQMLNHCCTWLDNLQIIHLQFLILDSLICIERERDTVKGFLTTVWSSWQTAFVVQRQPSLINHLSSGELPPKQADIFQDIMVQRLNVFWCGVNPYTSGTHGTLFQNEY